MNKKDMCREVAAANTGATRGELIELFVDEVGISKAAASTYASQINRELKTGAIKAPRPEETDEQIDARLTERFDVIDTLSSASCRGKIRSLIISGPAGLGKSYTVEKALEEYDPQGKKTICAKGFVRPTGLFLLLYNYRHPGNVIVLDDSDSIFSDQDSLNLLKAACDTTKKRIISWRAETKMLDDDGLPIERTFEFEGTIIFITNKDFDQEIAKGGKGSEHFEALVSRSHYVDCDMHSTKDYIIRIRQVIAKGMLRTQKGLDAFAERRILQFIEDHAKDLRELTLRVALKLSDVYLMDPHKFETLARVSCFKRQ